MSKVIVTSDEILKFDPMIHKIIKQEILQYWGNGLSVYSTKKEVTIGRLGMSFDDLMQFGRMQVFKQIAWFKQNGLDPQTGLPKNARMSTLMFQYLRNKFMSLSKSFVSRKNGGQVVNVEANRHALQKYVDDFDHKNTLLHNKNSFLEMTKCTKEVNTLIEKQATNKALFKLANRILSESESVSHVSYEDIEGFAIAGNDLTPESHMIVREEIESRLHDYCEKKGIDKIDVDSYLNRGKTVRPQFLPRGKKTLLMKLAEERGFNSQRKLAQHLGIGMTTLSNIIRGRSRGTSQFRAKIELIFGHSFMELLKLQD